MGGRGRREGEYNNTVHEDNKKCPYQVVLMDLKNLSSSYTLHNHRSRCDLSQAVLRSYFISTRISN